MSKIQEEQRIVRNVEGRPSGVKTAGSFVGRVGPLVELGDEKDNCVDDVYWNGLNRGKREKIGKGSCPIQLSQ